MDLSKLELGPAAFALGGLDFSMLAGLGAALGVDGKGGTDDGAKRGGGRAHPLRLTMRKNSWARQWAGQRKAAREVEGAAEQTTTTNNKEKDASWRPWDLLGTVD